MDQDSISVFKSSVDGVSAHTQDVTVAAEDVTSERITNMLDFNESFHALWNLIHVEYIFFVVVSYYIFVTRVRAVRTHTIGRRNILLFCLTVIWGVIAHLWRETPVLKLLVTGLIVNASYEYIFKSIFKALERFGVTPLPGWHVEEIRTEKTNDIARAESVKNVNHP